MQRGAFFGKILTKKRRVDMNIEFWIGAGVMVLLVVRSFAWLVLQQILNMAQTYADHGQRLINKHGATVGDLREAGVYDDLQASKEAGGATYRKAVRLAAFLMWWPIGPLFMKGRMSQAYDKVGHFKGSAGSLEAWEDVRRYRPGIRLNYFPKHLTGLIASLRVCNILW